jgi:hypothetical protein
MSPSSKGSGARSQGVRLGTSQMARICVFGEEIRRLLWTSDRKDEGATITNTNTITTTTTTMEEYTWTSSGSEVHGRDSKGRGRGWSFKLREFMSDEQLQPTLSLLHAWPPLELGLTCRHAFAFQQTCVLSCSEARRPTRRHLCCVHIGWDPARMGCYSGGECGLWRGRCAS